MKKGVRVRKRADGGKGYELKPKKNRHDKEDKPVKIEGWTALKRRMEREDKP